MGNVKGTYRLGKLYLEGLGVPAHCEFAVTVTIKLLIINYNI